MPLGLTLDHAGVLASTVRDVAIAFSLIAKHSSGYVPAGHADHRGMSMGGMRIGVPENFFVERIAPEVMLSFRAAVQTAAALGAHVTEIRLPDVEALNAVGRIAQLSEVSALLARYLDRRDEIGRDILVLVEQGLSDDAGDANDGPQDRGNDCRFRIVHGGRSQRSHAADAAI
jgi:aspartyl-tRNA(Asn)/glutamyl-tRNA(Gln) amidotransferase subunit A